MYVFPPKLHDLSSWSTENNTSNVEEMWEISAPPDHSLYWSLVLSFVIASPEKSDWMERLLGTEKEIQELMQKKKIQGKKLVPQSIKKQVMNFNPFKNQHSFYHNKDMTNIFRMFSLRLNRFANGTRRGSGEWGDDTKLMAATKMLKCNIQVYEIDSEGNKQKFKLNAPAVAKDTLVLFKHSGVHKMYKTKPPPGQDRDHKVINTYAFGMSFDHVIPLRRDALGHILKKTDLNHQIIRELQHDFNGSGNFLVSLMVKDSKKETVQSIYASPYIAWKLEAAGFVTDPCSLDEGGLSAFYHCLGLDSTFLLHVLYDYASNSFEHSDKTTRNPDTEILRALINIGRVLQNDCFKSKSFSMQGTKKSIAIKSYEEILCFNEYQRRVVENIADLQRNYPAQMPQTDDDGVNLMRRKQIITSLLEFYPKYFDYPNEIQAKDTVADQNKYRKFQNFIQRSEYYENLDNYTCLLFFDNFLFLDLPSEIVNSAVHSLFLTVFGYKLFPKCLHDVYCTKHVHTPEDCALRVIPFIFRSKFLESAKVVEQELKCPSTGGAGESPKQQSRKESKEKNPNSVLMQVTSGLKDLPEIKDEFLIARLRKYLDIATNITITDVDMKGVLAIERALQVIGETLNTTESASVIGHLLCSCLSQDVVEEFFRIRNHCLSKYRPRAMGGKLNLEKNLEKEIMRFRNIQDIVGQVHSAIKPVYASQLLRITDYMVRRGLCESKDIDTSVAQNMKREHNELTHIRKKIYIKNKSRYHCLANNLLTYIERDATVEKYNKFQKTGQLSALKFLFAFLANQSDEPKKNEILYILKEVDDLSKYFEDKANASRQQKIDILDSESQKIMKVVSDLRKITDSIFSEVTGEPSRMIDSSVVKNFFNDARSFSWFTGEEMLAIKEKIAEHMQSSRDAKASLEKILRPLSEKKKQNANVTEHHLFEEEARQLLVDIFTSEKNKSNILENLTSKPKVALKYLNSIKSDEQDVFEKNSDRDDLDSLMKFSETEEGTHLLLKMNFPTDLHLKVLQFLNRKVEFLLDRISHLKAILIEEDEEILSLWNWGKSEAIKTHTRYLMCQRYMREKDVKASLEMLLFDCMNILKTSKSLSRLWSKANDLFSGASLRDILSHGSTILEIVGNCLDQDDLPSHFIDKMLELIEDGDALRTLSDLWGKEKIKDLKQLEDMLDADSPSLREVQKWMKKRPGSVGGWKDYLPLLPLK
ncbi:hypothetical protein HNY73_003898 [Argiope bruennichi]|uniref:Uncharacterized protein n=1 Tax=Argiope bruennichi TaxID=94029 RepID=A0A8T0FMK2_ARGBR|nr:hypothetical protein HNY73_003898 [Argiope bruennichi]